MANVDILREAKGDPSGEWWLCFQWCRYVYDDGRTEHGYRFIWRRPNGNLQAGRGQARIPSIDQALQLIEIARSEGWADYKGEGAVQQATNETVDVPTWDQLLAFVRSIDGKTLETLTQRKRFKVEALGDTFMITPEKTKSRRRMLRT